METLTAAGQALIKQPMAIVMVLLAVVFTIAACHHGNRVGRRLLAMALTLISGVTAWMMASEFRW